MSSKVYFASVRAENRRENKITKIQKLFDAAGFGNLVNKGDLTAIKIHFGERGGDAYINPVFVRQVVDKLKEKGAKPFVTDTNTLYSGSRHNAVDHYTVAIEHGFAYAVVGAPIIISDGLRSQNFDEVTVDKKHYKTVKIASDIEAADSMIVMTHFKGHGMAGFGGTIKNLAMGCAPAAGKKDQHAVKMLVNEEKCIACGKCVDPCPVAAIAIGSKTEIDPNICLGCGQCLTICSDKAIAMDWGDEGEAFMEKMTEYAYGSVKSKKGKVGYMTFLLSISPDCDCVPWSDTPIVPDIGILASTDPVAIDQAALDLINKQRGHEHSELKCNHGAGQDKFKGLRPELNGETQITYGEKIGLGTTKYELIEIK